MNGSPMIKVEGLTRCFGDLVAVDHLDLEIFAFHNHVPLISTIFA